MRPAFGGYCSGDVPPNGIGFLITTKPDSTRTLGAVRNA
jgi:hypothetical protein